MVNDVKTVNINIRATEELRDNLKMAAAENGMTMTEFLEDLISHEIKKIKLRKMGTDAMNILLAQEKLKDAYDILDRLTKKDPA